MDEESRFRRALKSPLVMMGLCLLAGIAIYVNVIGQTMNTAAPAIAHRPPSMNDLNPQIPQQKAHEEEALQWIDHLDRDPFSPVRDVKSVVKRSESSNKPSRESRLPPQVKGESKTRSLTLKAIAIEAEDRSAVINRRVVYEGEMIEGYEIVSIQLNGVWLIRHGKKQFITFETNSTSS